MASLLFRQCFASCQPNSRLSTRTLPTLWDRRFAFFSRKQKQRINFHQLPQNWVADKNSPLVPGWEYWTANYKCGGSLAQSNPYFFKLHVFASWIEPLHSPHLNRTKQPTAATSIAFGWSDRTRWQINSRNVERRGNFSSKAKFASLLPVYLSKQYPNNIRNFNTLLSAIRKSFKG